MKKHVIAVAAFAAVLAALTSPVMAFQSVGISTVTAKTTTAGTKVAQFTLAIKDTSSPFGASTDTIRWTGVDPLTDQWKISTQLLVVNSTVTDRHGGIKIYTDNTAADASPKFVDPTPTISTNTDSAAAGLLEIVPGQSTTTIALPMAWTIKTSTKVPGTDLFAADPNNQSDTNSFQWLFMTDKFNWASGIDFNGDGNTTSPGDQTPQALDSAYTTMIKNVGVHFGQSDTQFGGGRHGDNAYVYMQANFSNAQVQTDYRTTTLRVEAFIE